MYNCTIIYYAQPLEILRKRLKKGSVNWSRPRTDMGQNRSFSRSIENKLLLIARRDRCRGYKSHLGGGARRAASARGSAWHLLTVMWKAYLARCPRYSYIVRTLAQYTSPCTAVIAADRCSSQRLIAARRQDATIKPSIAPSWISQWIFSMSIDINPACQSCVSSRCVRI